jgi:putative transposase
LRGRKPLALCLEEAFQHELEALVRRHTTSQQIVLRARIILLAHQEQNNQQIAQQLGLGVDMVRHWRGHWIALQEVPLTEMSVTARFADAPRPGAPAKISAEAYCQIMAIACQPPETFGRPITHWTERELAEEAQKQQIVKTISPRQVGRFLKRSLSQTASLPLLADQRRRPGQGAKDQGGLSDL